MTETYAKTYEDAYLHEPEAALLRALHDYIIAISHPNCAILVGKQEKEAGAKLSVLADKVSMEIDMWLFRGVSFEGLSPSGSYRLEWLLSDYYGNTDWEEAGDD